MKAWNLLLVVVLIVPVLVGCGNGTETIDPETIQEAAAAVAEAANSVYGNMALDTSYEGALPVGSQLALGTLLLEGTENAVTPEQAATLLPLWQAIESGSLQGDAELDAVLNQIAEAMTEEQLAAIAAMQLTNEEMRRWMEEQGLATLPGGGPGAAKSEEERAAMRATREAMGGVPGGPGAGLSEEERAAMQATAQAGGLGGNGGQFGKGQVVILAGPVVELLSQKTAE